MNFLASMVRRAFDRPPLFFGLLSALFYSPLLLGYCFLPTSYLSLTPLWYDPSVIPGNYDLFDAIIYFSPLDEFLKQQLAQGVFPFWNPYNLGGHAVAFNGQTGFFYPPKLLLLTLFPAWLAHGVSLFFHTWLAGYSSCRLARKFDLGDTSCLFFGVAWMFNGYLSVWLELGYIAICAAWTPLLILAALAALDQWRYVPALAGALAMLLVSAHLQLTLNYLLFGLVVGFYLAGRWSAHRLLRFSTGLLLGFGLAAPYLLPSAVLMSESQRPVMTSDFLLSTYRQFLTSVPPTMLLPDLYGNPGDFFCLTRISNAGTFIYSETCLYIGIVPLFFACLAAYTRGGRHFLSAAVLVLVVPATPIYSLLGQLPGLNHVNSIRFVGLVHLLLLVAAGFGFDHWRNKEGTKPYTTTSRFLLLAGALSLIPLARILMLGWQACLRPGVLRLPEPSLFLSEDSYRLAVKTGFENCYALTNPGFVVPALIVILLPVLGRYRKERVAPVLLLATILDLATFSYRYNPVESHTRWFPSNSEIAFLQQHGAENRVAGLSTIKPNTLLPFALTDAGGYDSFYPRDSAIYLEALQNRPPIDNALPTQVLTGTDLSGPLLDLMSVRFLVGRPGQPYPPGTRLAANDRLPIFERASALPRAFLCTGVRLVTDPTERLKILGSADFPRGRVAIVESSNEEFESLDSQAQGRVVISTRTANSVTLDCQVDGPMLLVLTDAWAKGWRVSVDQQSRELHKVNQMFRGVVVRPGDKVVEFRFHPPLWKTSLTLFGLSILICLGLLGWGRGESPASEKELR